MVFREDTSLFVGSAGAVATIVLGWFLNSSLFGVVAGVFLGASVSLYVQSRTQRRTWKRELALQNIETIYGPLYKELNSILVGIDDAMQRFAFEAVQYPEWTRIQSEYFYYFVSSPLRSELDKFYQEIQKYNQLLTHLMSDVSAMITQEAVNFYERNDLREIYYGIQTNTNPADYSQISITNAVLFGKHPLEIPQSTSYSYIQSPQYAVGLQVKNQQGGYSMKWLDSATELRRFADFLKNTHEVVQKSPVVGDATRTFREITIHCRELMASLLNLIQEPWRI